MDVCAASMQEDQELIPNASPSSIEQLPSPCSLPQMLVGRQFDSIVCMAEMALEMPLSCIPIRARKRAPLQEGGDTLGGDVAAQLEHSVRLYVLPHCVLV